MKTFIWAFAGLLLVACGSKPIRHTRPLCDSIHTAPDGTKYFVFNDGGDDGAIIKIADLWICQKGTCGYVKADQMVCPLEGGCKCRNNCDMCIIGETDVCDPDYDVLKAKKDWTPQNHSCKRN